MRKIILLITLLTCLPALADMNKGIEYINTQKYTQAFSEFKPLADDGNAPAQYYIGYLYLNGFGIPQDNEQALYYLNQSAQAGDSMANAQLGYLYAEGIAVKKDIKKALQYYTAAAELGNSSALLNLGVTYYKGKDVEKNIEKAIDYFKQIPLYDKPLAGRYLGDIYQYEPGYTNYSEAVKYYTAAARGGIIEAYHALAYIKQKGLNGDSDYNTAMKYYKYAASKNYAPSLYALGIMYANGQGVERDLAMAYAWLSLAVGEKLDVAEAAQKQVVKNMTLTDVGNARRSILEIQKETLKNVQPPLPPLDTVNLTDTNKEPVLKKSSYRPSSRVRRRRR